MSRDALRRAILAAGMTLLLVASGLALSRGALGAQPQALQPVKYLPLIIGKAASAPEQTATALAAASATAGASPTSTATPTATPTATSTTTTTTASPTSDAQATVQLHIANATGWPLTYTLAGPTNASGAIAPNESANLNIRPGHYTITAQTHCNTIPVEFDTVPDVVNDITYVCP